VLLAVFGQLMVERHGTAHNLRRQHRVHGGDLLVRLECIEPLARTLHRGQAGLQNDREVFISGVVILQSHQCGKDDGTEKASLFSCFDKHSQEMLCKASWVWVLGPESQ